MVTGYIVSSNEGDVFFVVRASTRDSALRRIKRIEPRVSKYLEQNGRLKKTKIY